MQRTDKLLNVRTPEPLPSHFLAVYVDNIEAEAILANDPINAFVSRLPDGLACVATRTTVLRISM